jgi:hypothetical protein
MLVCLLHVLPVVPLRVGPGVGVLVSIGCGLLLLVLVNGRRAAHADDGRREDALAVASGRLAVPPGGGERPGVACGVIGRWTTPYVPS